MAGNALSITALVAIVIFVSREVLETIRRWIGRNREINAYRFLIGEEIRRNYLALISVKHAITEMHDYRKLKSRPKFYLSERKDGELIFRRKDDPDDDFVSGFPLRTIHFDMYNRLLPNIAERSNKVFQLVKQLYAQILEFEHIRSSLIQYLRKEEENHEMLIEGFLDYASDELADIEEQLRLFYLELMGEELKAQLRGSVISR